MPAETEVETYFIVRITRKHDPIGLYVSSDAGTLIPTTEVHGDTYKSGNARRFDSKEDAEVWVNQAAPLNSYLGNFGISPCICPVPAAPWVF